MEKYFDASYLWGAFPMLIPYLKVTFWVVILTVLFGTLLGFMLAAMKVGNSKIARKIANGYTTVLRCTPSIVLLFLVYYGVPALISNIGIDINDWDKIFFVVLTFTLQFGAIMSEVIRSAYESIDKGQFEAAVSVGLSNKQAYWRIVVPQAFVVALPNFGNALLELMKEGSLAYTIGLIDVMGKANLIIAGNYNSHALEIYIAISIIYWILSIAIEQFFSLLEKLFSKGKQVIKSV
ncbi:amino acid ABC transporter permease [Lederbergia graminis]|uniref:Amino acid ABC transporter permease n=1 Tax=Lederbergia graminis TaxID=735518 RepID=A0ABW0LHB9_9BACI|nr:amino acid ABC transporter permease [Paenibacillus bovis]HLU21552.1 amino acid ABC transporter permease [Bacillaceae bacterium]